MKKVVLLGDSIRLNGYGTVISKYLPKNVTVYQHEANDRFSKNLLVAISLDLENLKDADVIHFNAGLWDSSLMIGDNKPISDVKEYVNNMSRIADILLKITPKVIFSTITPNKSTHKDNSIKTTMLYNKKVTKMLVKKGVIINDLFSVINEDIDSYICEDNLHLNEKGIKAAAESVSKAILKIL